MTQTIIWSPQPQQAAVIACSIFEIFFGGARGGGKTDAMIGDWLQHSSTYGEHAVGIFFRRTLTQLTEVIERTRILFAKIGAVYNSQHNSWRMANGARLKFAYLERDIDASNYQGHSYTRVYIEEVTNFPSPVPINLLKATLRSSTGVPCGIRLTGNPGGPGHNWVKERYIDPDKRGYKIIQTKEEIKIAGVIRIISIERIFIPSKLADNQMLLVNDPTYILRVKQSGSEATVKAWLDGNWDIVDGAFFTELTDSNLLDPSFANNIPPGTKRFRSFDWGYAKPFSVGWYAISDGTWGLPHNALFRYREWYGASNPNVGLKLDVKSVARGILLRDKQEIIQNSVADPSIFINNGGPSIGQEFAINGVSFRRADNKRAPGWMQVRQRLIGENDRPMLYLSRDCLDTIKQLQTIQYDKRNSEDLDTESEDHALDDLRYGCMSRPWAPKKVSLPVKNPNTMPTINELMARHARNNRRDS